MVEQVMAHLGGDFHAGNVKGIFFDILEEKPPDAHDKYARQQIIQLMKLPADYDFINDTFGQLRRYEVQGNADDHGHYGEKIGETLFPYVGGKFFLVHVSLFLSAKRYIRQGNHFPCPRAAMQY